MAFNNNEQILILENSPPCILKFSNTGKGLRAREEGERREEINK